MRNIRSLLFVTILPTPLLAFSSLGSSPDLSILVSLVSSFAMLAGLLIAFTTARTPGKFVARLGASAMCAAVYCSMIFAVLGTWPADQTLFPTQAGGASGLSVLTGLIHAMAAVASAALVLFSTVGLVWMIANVEPREAQ